MEINKNATGNEASKAVGYAPLTHPTKIATSPLIRATLAGNYFFFLILKRYLE
jgi:hypothetical protein